MVQGVDLVLPLAQLAGQHLVRLRPQLLQRETEPVVITTKLPMFYSVPCLAGALKCSGLGAEDLKQIQQNNGIASAFISRCSDGQPGSAPVRTRGPARHGLPPAPPSGPAARMSAPSGSPAGAAEAAFRPGAKSRGRICNSSTIA